MGDLGVQYYSNFRKGELERPQSPCLLLQKFVEKETKTVILFVVNSQNECTRIPCSKDNAHELSDKLRTSFVDVFANFVSHGDRGHEKQSEDRRASRQMALRDLPSYATNCIVVGTPTNWRWVVFDVATILLRLFKAYTSMGYFLLI